MQERYARQIVLPEIGEAGQNKLGRASVLCVGAGGLGAPVLLYLAAAGVGHIGIIDPDKVDISNLHRQVLFETGDIGHPKAQVAGQRVHALNNEIRVETYDAALSPENAPDLFQAYDIIIDGTDNFATKFLINDAAVKYQRPWIYGAIQGFDGQAGVFDAGQGACYRCLYPAMPKAQIANCAESGVIGAVAGLVGMTQALQAIQLITGDASFAPLVSKLWMLDTRTMASHTLGVPKNPACPVCNGSASAITLESDETARVEIPEVTPANIGDDTVLVDVREQEGREAGIIQQALHCPLSDLQAGKDPELPKDRDVVLHCQYGIRSVQAAKILKQRGYARVYSMKGGYQEWTRALSRESERTST